MLRRTTPSRRLLALPIALSVLAAGASLALAGQDPEFIHVCVKNRNIKIVRPGAPCQRGAKSVALATEAALAALQNENAALQARVDELEMLSKRLHGYQGAIIERGGSGSGPGQPGGFLVEMNFCEEAQLDPNGQCGSANGYTLLSPLITNSDQGSVITFDAATTPDFPAIAALLTNGVDDVLKVTTTYQTGDGTFGGSGSSAGRESSFFYRTTQVTTGPGFVDLNGLVVDRVHVALDFISINFDQNNQSTSYIYDYRIFFGLEP